jgi:polyhydroxybutyrate depolymerase
MWDHHRHLCPEEAEAPINMLVMHGLADPFYGADTHMATNVFSPDSGPLVLGIDDTLTYWALRNGCVNEPVVTAPIVRFPDCPVGGEVSYYGLVNGATIWYRNGDYKLNQTGVDVSEKVVQFMQGDEGWLETPNTDPIAIARSFIVYTPTTYDESQSAPVVIALHGRYGNGAGMASLIDFNRVAEGYGIIAVYPDGIDNEWNYVRGIMGYEQKPYDDSKFLADLVDDLAVDLNIDMSRIYALGFSNGGFMAQRLACDNPERYAGLASVAATGFLGMQTVCRNPVPVTMAFINGTEDNNVSWTGYRQIQGQNVPTNLSVNETFGFWADWDQCEGAGTTEDLPQLGNSPETSVRTLTLDDCADGVTLKLFGVIGGGHNWPGVPDAIITEVAGNVNLDIQASDAIWTFFSGGIEREAMRESDE